MRFCNFCKLLVWFLQLTIGHVSKIQFLTELHGAFIQSRFIFLKKMLHLSCQIFSFLHSTCDKEETVIATSVIVTIVPIHVLAALQSSPCSGFRYSAKSTFLQEEHNMLEYLLYSGRVQIFAQRQRQHYQRQWLPETTLLGRSTEWRRRRWFLFLVSSLTN